MALGYYDLTVNPEHGLSSYITGWGDYEGHFKVVEDAPDLATQALERYKARRENENRPIKPGDRFHVEFTFDPTKEVTD